MNSALQRCRELSGNQCLVSSSQAVLVDSQLRASAPSLLIFSRVAWSILECAHRATVIHPIDPSKLACFSSLWTGTHVGPTAAVERAHSYRARSGSTGPMWASVQSFYRGGSASKKGTWPLLPLPSEPAHSVKACDPLPGRRHRFIERAARLSRPLQPWR